MFMESLNNSCVNQKLKLEQLREIAKKQGIVNYKSYKKLDLIACINKVMATHSKKNKRI